MPLAQSSCAQEEFQIYIICAVDMLLAYLNPISNSLYVCHIYVYKSVLL